MEHLTDFSELLWNSVGTSVAQSLTRDAKMQARTLDQASYGSQMQAKQKELMARMGPMQLPREKMVPGFGDAAFPLKVGDVGIANYDLSASPFGWHIIKRLE